VRLLNGPLVVFGALIAPLALWLAQVSGRVQGWLTTSWRRLLLGLALTWLLLAVIEDSGFAAVGTLTGPAQVAVALVLFSSVGSLLAARNRLVISEFVSFTPDNKAAGGIARLLVVELARLGQLYRRVDEREPLRAAGVNPGKASEASFKVEGVDESLRSVVSGDTSVGLGPFKIPAGAILLLATRLLRGPELSGSLHLEAGRYVLVAQLSGPSRRAWRVDREIDTGQPAPLSDLISELACRIFSDVGLGGSFRWDAVSAFGAGLRWYNETLVTRTDRRLNLKRAEREFMRVSAADSRMAALNHYNLAIIYRQLRQYDAAESSLRKAIDSGPDWRPYYALALGRGPIEQLALCRRVIEMQHDVVEAYDLAGQATLQLEDYANAVHYGEEAVRRAWNALLLTEFRSAPAREGAATSPAIAAARALARDCSQHLALAYFSSARKRRWPRRAWGFKRTELLLRQALAADPADAEVRKVAATFFNGVLGDPRHACLLLEQALRIAPRDLEAWTDLALIRSEVRDRSTEAELKRVVALVIDLAADPTDQATEAALRALFDACQRIIPASPEAARIQRIAALLPRLEMIRDAGQPAPDAVSLKAELTSMPTEQWWERAQLAHAASDRALRDDAPKLALEYLDQARLALSSSTSDLARRMRVEAMRARALQASGDRAGALTAARRAIESDPQDTVSWREIAGLYGALEDVVSAKQAWLEVTRSAPSEADAYIYENLSVYTFQEARGQRNPTERAQLLNEAREYALGALDLYGPDDADAEIRVLHWLGWIEQQQGRYLDAARRYEIIRAFQTEWPAPDLYAAHCYMRHGMYDEATRGFERLLREIEARLQRPGTNRDELVGPPFNQWRLGTFHCLALWGRVVCDADLGVQLSRALRRAVKARAVSSAREEALVRSVAEAASYEAEGRVLLRTRGGAAAAIDRLERALALNIDPETMWFLALAYEQRLDGPPPIRPAQAAMLRKKLQDCIERLREADIDGRFVERARQLALRIGSSVAGP